MKSKNALFGVYAWVIVVVVVVVVVAIVVVQIVNCSADAVGSHCCFSTAWLL